MSIQKFYYPSVLAVIFLVMSCFATVPGAYAGENADAEQLGAKYTRKDTPLMVIRFTHSNVIYEKSLYDTVARALQARPNTRFDVISVAKKSSDSDIQKQYNQIAARNADKVMTTLHEMAVPEDRVSFGKTVENTRSSEVRIYLHD